MIVECPLSIMVGRKRIAMNLNVYRNLFHLTNNKAKIAFRETIGPQLARLPHLSRINIEYTLYMPTRRQVDIANVCCIVDKFFCDALVSAGKLVDDNYNFLPQTSYLWGGVDKIRPRVEAKITEVGQ